MISEILLTGEKNAQTGREICTILKITARELTMAVRRERSAGHPICASTGKRPGYYLAADKEEMEVFCKKLLHRAGEIHKTRKECIKMIDSLPEKEAEETAVAEDADATDDTKTTQERIITDGKENRI